MPYLEDDTVLILDYIMLSQEYDVSYDDDYLKPLSLILELALGVHGIWLTQGNRLVEQQLSSFSWTSW